MSTFEPTPEQLNIIGHDPAQHACILAGPGTGKSATLVALIERLLSENVPHPKVKLLTFTRAATAELEAKVLNHAATATVHRPSTIHSFAISILLQNPGTGGFPEPLRIADKWENKAVVRETLKRRINCTAKQINSLVQEMAANWTSLNPEEDVAIDSALRARFLGAWSEHRTIYGYTLLDEIPFALRHALEVHDDLSGLNFDLLVVDEYQDLNACDLEVLRRVAARGCTIVGAGDDDQSIYSFRKAHPQGIRQFDQDYVGANNYPLSVTLRCGKRIINWANFMILGDPDRPLDRGVLTPRDDAPNGEVALLGFRGDKSEAKGITTLVQNLTRREKLRPSDILILLRADHNKMFSNRIRSELEAADIPCTDPTVVEEMLSDPGNRRLIAILRLTISQEDALAWATLIHLEARLNAAAFLDYVYARAKDSGSTFGAQLLAAFSDGFPDAPGRTGPVALALLNRVIPWLQNHASADITPEIGWGHWIIQIAGDEVAPSPTDGFRQLLEDLDELAEENQTFNRFLSQVQPLGRDLAQSYSDGVRIMTMTASKGLTTRATIIAGLEDQIIPRPGEDPSEERRLLYVAMTRSKEYLFGTWAGIRRGPTSFSGTGSAMKRLPTRFLAGGPVTSQDGNQFLKTRWK